MEITEIKVTPVTNDNGKKALAFITLVFDNQLAVHDISLIRRGDSAFLSMPARKMTRSCSACQKKVGLVDRYCSMCGTEQPQSQTRYEADELFNDVVHPIQRKFRSFLEKTVIEQYNRQVTEDQRIRY